MRSKGIKRKINEHEGSTKKKKMSDSPSKDQPKASSSSAADSDINLSSLIDQQDWKDALAPEFTKDYFISLQKSLVNEIESKAQVFPPTHLIFNALNGVPLKDVKIVLLGQDPYHDDGQAMGLSFSVPHGVKVPPSLKNMYKELETDIPDFQISDHGCLDKWADQGVLLLNATLTVQAHKPNSHSKFGWQKLTDEIIKNVSEHCSGVIFMLWGNFAHKKEKLIDSSKHKLLKDAHPSPLSFGKFKGCKCFSRANDELRKLGRIEIDWTL